MAPVAVIGAGITGLAAADALREAGLPVVLFESASRAGGVILSHREGPWLAEGGPNTLLETWPRLVEWLAHLGLDRRWCVSNPAADARYVVRKGRPWSLPGSPLRFVFSRLYSLRGKLRLLAEPWVARGQGEESVAAFVRRRLGGEFLDYAIDPLVSGTYAGDPAALSIQHAFPRIHALEQRYGSLLGGQFLGARERRQRGEISRARARKGSFDDGLQVLPDALAARLREALRLNVTVIGIRGSEEGWHLTCETQGQRFESIHPAVLYCGTAHGLARLPIQASAPSLAELSRIRHPPVTSVVLGFRRAEVGHACSGFGMLVPHCEGFGILGTIFSSSLFPGRAPQDHLLLTTYVGGARKPELAELPDGPLVDLVLRDLRQLLEVSGRPVFHHLTRWQRAIPQYEVGYGRYRQRLAEFEAAAPGFFVAGHFRDGVALSDTILAGRNAAARIQTHLGPAAAVANPSAVITMSPSR